MGAIATFLDMGETHSKGVGETRKKEGGGETIKAALAVRRRKQPRETLAQGKKKKKSKGGGGNTRLNWTKQGLGDQRTTKGRRGDPGKAQRRIRCIKKRLASGTLEKRGGPG